MQVTQTSPGAQQPRAWDDEDNKPVIPKVPGPRRPGYALAGAR